MSMQQYLWLMFMPIRLQKLYPKCRYDDDPILCQKKMVAMIAKEHNYTGSGGDGLEYSGSGDYIYYDYPVPTAEDNFIHYLKLVLFPYLLLVGTFGNLAAVILLRRYSFDVWSSCLYVIILFPMDLIKLYVECGNQWLESVHSENVNLSFEILLLSNAVCKVYTFTYSLLLHEYQWVMVAVAIEVAIATKNPSLIYKMCTRDRATAIILFISVLLISLNLHYFWTYGLTKPGDDLTIDHYMCSYINELSDQFRDYIWPIIDFFIGQVIPFTILVTIVVMCVYKRFKVGSKDKEQEQRLEKYFLDLKTLMELRTAMTVYIFIAALNVLCEITERGLMHFGLRGSINIPMEQRRLVKILMRTVTFFLMSHRFWIFYAMCSRFRKDTKGLLKAMCRPFVKKYRKSHSRSCTLLNEEHDYRRSWQTGPGQFTMSEEMETL